jgi:hypothetical protein
MSLDNSIAELMIRLADWSRFPKYQLERRVDIFLTPFLASYVGWRLAGDASAARLVAPEFPLLASREGKPARKNGKKAPTAHTVNVDYLLHLERRTGQRSWVLVELKTDRHSYRDRQDVLYWKALDTGMSKLRKDLEFVRDHTKERHRPKYDAVELALKSLDHLPAESLELAYLGPGASRASAPDCVRDADPEDPRRDRIHFLSLSAFARDPDDWVPETHRALWKHVRGLLERIAPEEYLAA